MSASLFFSFSSLLSSIHSPHHSSTQKPTYDDEGVGEGAPIAFNTGIAEVALPIEVKLRNIEETEKARKMMESSKGNKKAEPIGRYVDR